MENQNQAFEFENDRRRRAGGSRQERRRRENARRRRLILIVGILGLVLLILLVLALRSGAKPASVLGKWDIDGTVYIFKEESKGVMETPGGLRYEFVYELERSRARRCDVLTIDFKDEKAKDAVYEYRIIDELLVLTGGSDNSAKEYVLTKKKQ